MKRYKLLTLLIISVLIITGCATKKSTKSVSEFREIAKNLNMTTYSPEEYGYAEDASTIITNDYSILFYKIKRGFDINGMYIDEVKNVYSAAGIKDTTTNQEATIVAELTTKPIEKNISKGKNWSSVEVITDSKYYYVIMVDDTLLKITSNLDKKDEVKKVIDAMKY